MNLTKKIATLFSISLFLMIIIGFWIDSINSQRVEKLVKEKYVKVANELFSNIDDSIKLETLIKKYELKKIDSNSSQDNSLYFKPLTFGHISIFKESFHDEFIINIKYLDEELYFKTSDDESLNEQLQLNILIFLDIFALLLIFLFILKLISPLKKITSQINLLSQGDFSSRIDVKSNDEMGILANSFNKMASNLEEMITSREELLRDIGHELRTPIAKGKFIVEKVENEKQQKLLKKIFSDLESLTNQLIELEKIDSINFELKEIDMETLLVKSLEKLYIDDESKIKIDINSNFKILCDDEYLTMAIKNLIDNALKYATQLPVEIEIDEKSISIKNMGEKLSKNIEYYLKPFTQEVSHRNGFGLGLSIVNKIIYKHNFKLDYSYLDNKNHFTIKFD